LHQNNHREKVQTTVMERTVVHPNDGRMERFVETLPSEGILAIGYDDRMSMRPCVFLDCAINILTAASKLLFCQVAPNFI
jgi:hypothetical protein